MHWLAACITDGRILILKIFKVFVSIVAQSPRAPQPSAQECPQEKPWSCLCRILKCTNLSTASIIIHVLSDHCLWLQHYADGWWRQSFEKKKWKQKLKNIMIWYLVKFFLKVSLSTLAAFSLISSSCTCSVVSTQQLSKEPILNCTFRHFVSNLLRQHTIFPHYFSSIHEKCKKYCNLAGIK